MRYIRTKDRLYDGSLFLREYTGWYFCEKTKSYAFNESEIIKTANTIEELCDELIIKNPNNDEEFYRKVFVYEGAWKSILNEKHAKHCTNRDIYEHDVEIFGAIWVIDSNGVPTLKPVAKMNDKGDLELL